MRKLPRQQRSRQMVEALLDATARCITENGLDGTTTPRIAALAGVSVGSLYQYFDGKEELLGSLIERMADDIVQGLRHQPVSHELPLRVAIGTTIRLGASILTAKGGLYIELARNWHRLPMQNVTVPLQEFLTELTKTYFLNRHVELPPKQLETAIFIAVNSTVFTMVRLVSQDNSGILQNDAVEGLIDMISGYFESTLQ